MNELVVVSGKGGTGKTVITGNIAALAKKKVLADCDVDASNLHLLLHPKIKEKHDFYAGLIPHFNQSLCIGCHRCYEVCRFDAIQKENRQIRIDPISCEGCGLCSLVCSVKAIQMKENCCGEWFISETEFGPLVHARLGIGEENSGKLVSLVREKSRLIAEKKGLSLIVIDGPPGIGCPLIATLTGAHLAVVVTEPSLSGIHDLERVVKVASHFKVKTVVIINKYDINIDQTKRIEKWCIDMNIEVVGRIRFDHMITKAMLNGLPVVKYGNHQISREISDIWQRIENSIIL